MKTAVRYKKHEIDSGWAWFSMVGTFISCMFAGGIAYSMGVYYAIYVKIYPNQTIIIGLLTGIPTSFILLFGRLGIFIAEKFGYSQVIMIGTSIISIGFLASSFVQNNLSILCLTQGIMVGFGCGLILTPSICSIPLSFDKYHLIAHSLGVSGIAVGYVTFPFIYDRLIAIYGIANSLFICSAISLHLLVTAVLFKNLKRNPDQTDVNLTSMNTFEMSKESILAISDNLSGIKSIPQATENSKDNLENIEQQGTCFQTLTYNKIYLLTMKRCTRTHIVTLCYIFFAFLEQAATTIITIMISAYSQSLGLSITQSSLMISLLGIGDLTGSLLISAIGILFADTKRRNSIHPNLQADTSVETVNKSKILHVKQIENQIKIVLKFFVVQRFPYYQYVYPLTIFLHALFSLCYLIVFSSRRVTFIFLCCLNYLYGATYGIRLALQSKYISAIWGIKEFNHIFGLYSFGAGIGAILVIPLTTWINMIFGDIKYSFYLMAVIFGICVLFLLIIFKLKKNL